MTLRKYSPELAGGDAEKEIDEMLMFPRVLYELDESLTLSNQAYCIQRRKSR